MRRMSAFVRESTAGQALLATLLFCFIFVVLFAGLYKAGLSYLQKERALRGTDMTALSVGAVYANGLQLVRYSNVALMASVIADVVCYVTTEGRVDLNLRGEVQSIQKVVFGINQSGEGPGIGAYPFLFWPEGIQMAENNQLSNNWPGFSKDFRFPVPPLPMFLFNAETSDLKLLLIPNMALKFRSAADVLPRLQKDRIFYYEADKFHPGNFVYFSTEEVESFDVSKHPGQMWVKIPGPYHHDFLRMKPVVTPGTNPINKDSFLGKSIQTASDLLANIPFDVTHADDPHNHTVLVYDQLPSNIAKGPGKGTLNFHSWSEVKLVGGGLSAWDITQPKFRVRLVNFEPQKLPFLRDWLSFLPGLDPSRAASFTQVPDPTQGLPMPKPEDIGDMFGVNVPSLPRVPGGI